jgi:hypothetical protein
MLITLQRSALLIILFFAALPAYPSIAVLPYRVSDDTGISGDDYARLLSLTALLIKKIEVQSPHETAIGMRDLGINPEIQSAEDLDIFGKKYRLSYILTGTLRKKGGIFISDNILYSVKGGRIISRFSSTDRDLFRSAEKNIRSSLINIPDRADKSRITDTDIAVLIDLSYYINTEWDNVKSSLITMASNLIEQNNYNIRIYILPYSGRKSFESAAIYSNSIKELKKGLNSLHPAGSPDIDNFSRVLNYSLKNIKWRSSALKKIIIINNSSAEGLFFPEKSAFEAKNKKIIIDVISGGRLIDQKNSIERLADITDGSAYNITYLQKVYDTSGAGYHLYMERSRVFRSQSFYQQWKKGFLKNGKASLNHSGPAEIYHRHREVSPDKMVEIFSQSENVRIIQQDPLLTNLNTIISSIASGITGNGSPLFSGKALILSGNISLWIKIPGDSLMTDFEKMEKRGFYNTAPFYIRKAPSELYGVELVPVDKKIEKGFIPDSGIADIEDIIKHPEKYTAGGIGSPPVWFIEFKTEKTERFGTGRDIRD